MPAPNNKADRETLKALVRVKLDEGKTWKQVSMDVGVSESTIWRWMKESESNTKEIDTIKQALNLIDHEALQKLSYFSDLIIDELIKKAGNGALGGLDVIKLSRTGVEVAKMLGIRTDKVMMRDGTLVKPTHPLTVEGATALLLSQAQADAAAADRLREEREAFKVMQAEGHMKDVTPSR